MKVKMISGKDEPQPVQREAPDPRIGKVIMGDNSTQYKITHRLGQGGMAEVYKAEVVNQRADAPRYVAVKFPMQSEQVDRFVDEIAVMMQVIHHNVVRFLDFGQDGRQMFCVMEYLEGSDLNQAAKKGRFTWEELAPIMMAACEGVAAIHKTNKIHRDLTPKNIFRTIDGDIKIIDFGIVQDSTADRGLTQTGQVLGNLAYIAPEQVGYRMEDEASRGEPRPDGKVDLRMLLNSDELKLKPRFTADIYALGIVMYELLTGRLPYPGNNAEIVAAKIRGQRVVPPRTICPDIPGDVEKIIMRAIETKPSARYQTVDELKRAIANAKPVSTSVNTARFDGMRRRVAGTEVIEDSHDDDANRAAQIEEAGKGLIRERRNRFARALVGTAVCLGLVGAGVRYKEPLVDALGAAREEITERLEALRASQETPDASAPITDSSTPPQTQTNTYLVSINSNPPGAHVFEIVDGREIPVGNTPFNMYVGLGEHMYVVYSAGYPRVVVGVDENSPNQTVTFQRVGKNPGGVRPRRGNGSKSHMPGSPRSEDSGAPPSAELLPETAPPTEEPGTETPDAG